MVTDAVPEGQEASTTRRVDWIELFFDLAMAAFITQLAHGLHGSPGPSEFATFIAWSIPAWWAWTNVMVCINVLPVLAARPVGIALLGSMATIGLMAASVTETVDRVWAFALANGILRLILLVLWVSRAKKSGQPLWGAFLYNGATALIWLASALVPTPVNFVLWGIAILIEVVLLRGGGRARTLSVRVDVAHASERLGLFMIILMGESVLSLVLSLSDRWTAESGLAALIGFTAIAFIAWGFFGAGIGVIEEGLAHLNAQHSIEGLLDTVMFLPYLIVVSITMFAAGLATAVDRPGEPLSLGAAIGLGGGVALFYLTNSIVILRYGTPWRQVLVWALPGVVLPVAVILVSSRLSATVTLCLIAAVAVFVVVESAVIRHRREKATAG